MRFLFVGRFPEAGGSALASLPAIKALRQSGHTVQLAHWMIPKHTDWFVDQDLLNLGLAKRGNIFSKLYKLAQMASQYDVIVSISELTPTYACQIAGWITKRPVYGELQVHLDAWITDNSHFLHHQLIRLFYRHLSGLRCVSQPLADYAVQSLRINSNKTFVIYNGFNIENIKKLANEPLPSCLEYFFQNPVILCVGRLVQQKRFDLAIKAFAIAQDRLPDQTKLLIAGEGPLYDDLQNLIHQLDLKDKVYLVGFHSNPFSLFKKAFLFLLSSDYEGFGRVLIESMICGCPVIAHDCPVGPREILKNEQYGLLCHDNSEQTLAKAIIKLFNNQNYRQELIHSGYQRCLDFEQRRVSIQYINVLTERLKSRTECV